MDDIDEMDVMDGLDVTDVSVNLLWCVPGQVGGSEDYLVRQLLGLGDIGSPVRPTVYVPQGFARAHPELDAVADLVEAPVSGGSRVRRIVAESTWLFERTADHGLVHHGGGTMPVRAHQPTVVTIHDLQYLEYPRYFGRVKRAYLHHVMPRSADRATVITVPTEFVRGTVIEAYGIEPEAVFVVPHGIETTLGAAATPEAELRDRFHLQDGPVVVLPAVTHPHKGHRFLLEVMAAHWRDPALRLVLIGGAGAAEDDVLEAIRTLGLGDRVVRTGRLPANDRDGLLRMATAMAFPSEYEGFGAPIVEAMVLGTPVICSDRACLPEVAGGAAIVLPLDVDAWSGALAEAVSRRDELVAAGHERAKSFTAARSAQALLGAYRGAAR
jgi:glycosyltransferase involved in cell wall biosynthesis